MRTALPNILREALPRFARLATFVVAVAQPLAGHGDEDPFPAKPTTLVSDKAGLLLPARAAALESHLAAGARGQGIWIYVLTLPSLNVAASRQHERLAELAHRYADSWGGEQVAMVLLFDDESGDVIMVASRVTERHFPAFARNLALTDPLSRITRSDRLTREKVEQAAHLILAVLTDLQNEARREARQRWWVNGAMAVFFVASGGLLLWSKLRRRLPRPPGPGPASNAS